MSSNQRKTLSIVLFMISYHQFRINEYRVGKVRETFEWSLFYGSSIEFEFVIENSISVTDQKAVPYVFFKLNSPFLSILRQIELYEAEPTVTWWSWYDQLSSPRRTIRVE